MKLNIGFTYKGRKVKSFEIKRRPTIADRVRAVQFSRNKFGDDVEDAVACYLISELCEFEGEKVPAEFLLENMDYEDFVLVWEEVTKFRPPDQAREEAGEVPSEQGMGLQGDKEDDRGGGNRAGS